MSIVWLLGSRVVDGLRGRGEPSGDGREWCAARCSVRYARSMPWGVSCCSRASRSGGSSRSCACTRAASRVRRSSRSISACRRCVAHIDQPPATCDRDRRSRDRARLGTCCVAETDAAEYERLISEAATAMRRPLCLALDRARVLWQGAPHDEFAHEPWAEVEVRRLGDRSRRATEDLVVLLLDVGDDGAAIGHADAADRSLTRIATVRGCLLMRALESGRSARPRRCGPVRGLSDPVARRHRDRTGCSARRTRPSDHRRRRPDCAARAGHPVWSTRGRPDPGTMPVGRSACRRRSARSSAGRGETADIWRLLGSTGSSR